MRKVSWNITASIGLVVFTQAASAALDSRGATVIGNPASLNVSQLLAQAPEPTASPPAQPPDSKPPQDQSPQATPSPPPAPPSKTEVVARPPPSAAGCGLRYMAAEVAGKAKNRKWKEFRQEECAASTTQAIFPSAIAPKYSGVSPDKARTLTCADQFTANKATNANGGLKWVEMGGGYYSECVSRLKG